MKYQAGVLILVLSMTAIIDGKPSSLAKTRLKRQMPSTLPMPVPDIVSPLKNFVCTTFLNNMIGPFACNMLFDSMVGPLIKNALGPIIAMIPPGVLSLLPGAGIPGIGGMPAGFPAMGGAFPPMAGFPAAGVPGYSGSDPAAATAAKTTAAPTTTTQHKFLWG